MTHDTHADHDEFGGLHRDLLATRTRDRSPRPAPADGALRRRSRRAATDGLRLDASPTSPDTGTVTGTSSSCPSRVPSETEGPFPGDGTNGPNVLGAAGVVRSDIRTSFAGLNGTADGAPLDARFSRWCPHRSCAALAGRAVYLWHCDRLGRYSLYNAGVTNQNYLRGVQEADASGKVTFTTIYPGCYSGRWPHIHFEVYPSLAASTNANNKTATSQIALPKSANDLVYATTGYESSAQNQSQMTLASDGVFSDGASLELATVTGTVASGLTATLTIAI